MIHPFFIALSKLRISLQADKDGDRKAEGRRQEGRRRRKGTKRGEWGGGKLRENVRGKCRGKRGGRRREIEGKEEKGRGKVKGK